MDKIDNDVDDIILKNINEKIMVNAIEKVKYETIQNYIHDFYIVACVLILFIGLYLLNKSNFLCSVLVIIGVLLLHFKHNILPIIFKVLIKK